MAEAYEIYRQFTSSGKAPAYYSGGTELISMSRAGSINFDAVIDIKNIPECQAHIIDDADLIMGSAVTLSQISESGYFPLLCETVSRIADHTIQCKITIGGNIASTIIYREAALPLMITGSRVKIMNESGLREVPLSQVFDGRLHLNRGEFLVQILIDKNVLNLPYTHVKKTKIEKIDYPLISMAAIKRQSLIAAAVSGISDYPILLPSDALNNFGIRENERISNVIDTVEGQVISDLSGSKEYRLFVLKNVLAQMYINFNKEEPD